MNWQEVRPRHIAAISDAHQPEVHHDNNSHKFITARNQGKQEDSCVQHGLFLVTIYRFGYVCLVIFIKKTIKVFRPEETLCEFKCL